LPYPKVKDNYPVVAVLEMLGECPLSMLFLEIKTKLPEEQAIVLNLTTNEWG
jgi:hypothetical protein